MTLIVRKLRGGKAWKKAFLEHPDWSAAELPCSLAEEFIPSRGDQGWLSCFEISAEEDSVIVAGALSFLVKPAESAEQVFLATTRLDIEKAGLEIRQNAGGTFHKDVDLSHVEIKIHSMGQVVDLAAVFIAGTPIYAKGSKVDASRLSSLRTDKFRLADAAADPAANSASCAHILKHIADGLLFAAGQPTA